ncbi:MAG: cysteine desulfurase family protein [Balneolaceae bacterium]|nr:cysteine desulfurase family protein [Balneolaceae bacterium]
MGCRRSGRYFPRTVARLIGAKPTEIYFTSGATEAINLSLLGVCKKNDGKGNHLITCVTEHKAVLDTCRQLEKQGFRVTYLDVDESGALNLEALENAITDQTILVSLMSANNETGVIHPLKEISRITREKGALLMTDATQALGKIPFEVQELGVDLVAFSAHKLYGPKGVGGLYVRNRPDLKLSPLFFGGGHEKRLRPGTLNVPGIVGFGKACEICANEMDRGSLRLSKWRDKLEAELRNLEHTQMNGRASTRLPHTTNLSFRHIDGSKLIRSLPGLALLRVPPAPQGPWRPSHVLKSYQAFRISWLYRLYALGLEDLIPGRRSQL